jgi:hypothetical protein
MRHALGCLVGASSPLDELIPTLEGWIQARRVMEWDELDEDQREKVKLFFELAMEHLSEKMEAAREGVNIRAADVIKLAYEDDFPSDWDASNPHARGPPLAPLVIPSLSTRNQTADIFNDRFSIPRDIPMTTTTNLYLAAFLLARGHEPASITGPPGRKSITFPTATQSDLGDYNRGVPIGVRAYVDALIKLKRLVNRGQAEETDQHARPHRPHS